MEVFNGSDLVLVIETASGSYKPIAGAKSFTITVNRTIRDVSHKHVGDAMRNEYGRYNWGISIDGLVSYYADYISFNWFLMQQLAKNKVKFIASLLDYQTDGLTPLTQTAALQIIDSNDLAVIDADTTSIQCQNNHFATNAVFTGETPKANYGQAVIESVEQTGGDDDNPTFSVSLKGDKLIKSMDIASTAGYSVEYQAVYNAYTNKPSGAVAAAFNTFVETLVSGNVWTKLDILIWLAAHTDTAYENLVNLINPGSDASYKTTSSPPPFVAFEGVTSAITGNACVDTNWNPTDDGVNYTLNDCCQFVYTRSNIDGNLANCGGDDGTNDSWIMSRNSDLCNTRVNSSLQDSNANTDSRGFYVAVRTGVNAGQTYKNGVGYGAHTDASTVIPDCSFLIGARGTVGGTPSAIDTRQHSVWGAGGSLTGGEVTILTNAVETLMDSFGTGVIP